MSRLPRPHISDSIKVEVALRQLNGFLGGAATVQARQEGERLTAYFETLLRRLAEFMQCPRDQLRLDHEPALQNRVKVKWRGVITRYRPAANHPAWLSYRPHDPQYVGSHLIKTNVAGDHGQHSDAALARKNKRIAKNRDPKRRKAAIRSRGFQNGPKRKWPSRPFR